MKQENSTRLPATLDIIRIDGRWAQVCGVGTKIEEPLGVKYLDDFCIERVDLRKYDLIKC